MACRSNLAMCKLNLAQYDAVVDQCERILDFDPNNVKASFRMSKAVFAMSSDNSSLSQVKTALKYATIAKDGQPGDAKVKSHFDEVKAKHDELAAKEEETKQAADTSKAAEAPAEETKGSKIEQSMRSRVKIPTANDSEEEKKEEPKPAP